MPRLNLRIHLLLALACLLLGACSASPNRAAGPDPAEAPPAARPPAEVAPEATPEEVIPGEAIPGEAIPVPEAPPAAAAPTVELVPAELTTVGWDELSGSPVVLLRELESGQVLPIWIGLAEARAISLELHGVELARPMTHDLMVDLLAHLGAELEEVVVHDLRQGTYYGLLKLRLAGEEEPRWVDTRPSDGLALALRADAEIRIARKLVEERPEYEFLAPDAGEQVVRSLGLTVVAVDEVWRRELSLPDRPGLVVIAASGEGRRRGLMRGDLIVDIGGRTPRQPVDFLAAIAEVPAGEKLRLTYWRAGSSAAGEETTVELDLELPDRPKVEHVV